MDNGKFIIDSVFKQLGPGPGSIKCPAAPNAPKPMRIPNRGFQLDDFEAKMFGEIKAEFQNAVWFEREMQQKKFQ